MIFWKRKFFNPLWGFIAFFHCSFINLAISAEPLGWVREIRVQNNKKIEKDAIVAKVQSHVGEKASPEQIAKDIRTLYGLGYFDDIQVDYTDGVLTFIVQERPTITKIDFDGNEQINSTDLKGVIKLKEYSILDINKVKNDISLIQKHYEEKGFYLAKVSHEVRPTSKPDEVELIYKVNDYEKVRVKKITFINNHRFSDEVLKNVFRNTKEGNFFSWLTSSGSFKESAFKQDLQLLTYFYLNEGYVKFRYDPPIVTISEDKKWLFISIYVDEGDPYKVSSIDFGGDLLYEKSELFETLELRPEQTFSIQKRNDDIQRLTEKYQDLGYAFVNVNPQMNIQDDTKTLDIRYDFEKGELAYFGEINIVGNTKTRDKVIRRELRIREGELYHGTRLRISRERVERLGFFAPGEVVFNSITRKDHKNIVDIEISVKERSTGTVTLGLGYGSVQKFFFSTQVSEMNLFGRGQNLSLSAQLASDRRSRSLNLGFTEPYFLDSSWSAGFDLFYLSFPIPGKYLQYRKGFNLRTGHPIEDDLFTYITYKFENLRLDEKRYDLDPELDTVGDEGNLSSVIFSVVRDKRNNRFETTKGNYESLSTEYAGIGADKYFTKFTGEGRFYYPILKDLVYRTKLEAGYIVRTTDRPIPPSEKFYLGGPNNLKGFDMFTVSPKSPAGTPLGGVSQFLYIHEFEFPLIREAGLKTVLFYDIGNSYATVEDFIGLKGIKQDVGFGFRWFSPLGPLRFEWGFPIRPRLGESDVVFNFFIGPPF